MEEAQLPRTADAIDRSPCGFGISDCDMFGECLSLTKEAQVFFVEPQPDDVANPGDSTPG